jgi:hypothetical protein
LAHPGAFLSALTLPRLQPFTIRLPEHLLGTSCSSPTLDDYRDCASQLALTNHRLCLLKASPSYPEQLWVAPNPLPPTSGVDGQTQQDGRSCFQEGVTPALRSRRVSLRPRKGSAPIAGRPGLSRVVRADGGSVDVASGPYARGLGWRGGHGTRRSTLR